MIKLPESTDNQIYILTTDRAIDYFLAKEFKFLASAILARSFGSNGCILKVFDASQSIQSVLQQIQAESVPSKFFQLNRQEYDTIAYYVNNYDELPAQKSTWNFTIERTYTTEMKIHAYTEAEARLMWNDVTIEQIEEAEKNQNEVVSESCYVRNYDTGASFGL